MNSIWWWLTLACMFVIFHFAMRHGTEFIQRKTGRDSKPAKGAIGYDAVFFGIAFVIMFPPIYFMPNAGLLTNVAFFMLAIVIANLVSQAIYGRKVTLSEKEFDVAVRN